VKKIPRTAHPDVWSIAMSPMPDVSHAIVAEAHKGIDCYCSIAHLNESLTINTRGTWSLRKVGCNKRRRRRQHTGECTSDEGPAFVEAQGHLWCTGTQTVIGTHTCQHSYQQVLACACKCPWGCAQPFPPRLQEARCP